MDVICALFSERQILGDAAFTHKPIDHQNGERGKVTACDARARGQYSILSRDSIFSTNRRIPFSELELHLKTVFLLESTYVHVA